MAKTERSSDFRKNLLVELSRPSLTHPLGSKKQLSIRKKPAAYIEALRKAKSEQKQCDRCKRYYKDQHALNRHIARETCYHPCKCKRVFTSELRAFVLI